MPRDPETSLKKADDYRATLHNSSLAHIEDASVSAFRTPPSGYETHHLSDFAVDAAFQGRGIGRKLMEQVRREAGAESMCLLLAYPDAANFYQGIGMNRFPDAFLLDRDF
jgi:GNAT superfamily N-acetyltransferase